MSKSPSLATTNVQSKTGSKKELGEKLIMSKGQSQVAGTECRWCLRSNLKVVGQGAKARWFLEQSNDYELLSLVVCEHCDLMYFTPELSAAELDNMYKDYRGDKYLTRRNKYEPWYTKKVNDAIGHSEAVLEIRRKHLEDLINSAIKDGTVTNPQSVLDVGGDEGQFIPNLPSISKKVVLEISGVRPLNDVIPVTSWEEAALMKPDLVMLCHVLEHTASARDLLEQAYKVLPESGGICYVEIPLDRPNRPNRLFITDFYGHYVRWLCRFPKTLFIAADLLGLLSRRVFKSYIPGSVIKCSEHINFFNTESVERVAIDIGFDVAAFSRYAVTSGVPRMDVDALGVLLAKPSNLDL